MMDRVAFTIYGEPASKANSREIAKIRKRTIYGTKTRTIVRKSDKALAYLDQAIPQIPLLPELMIGELVAHFRIFYRTEKPDLDESVILDMLQDRIYVNDRQVRERHAYHFIDRKNPRVDVVIERRVEKRAGLEVFAALAPEVCGG